MLSTMHRKRRTRRRRTNICLACFLVALPSTHAFWGLPEPKFTYEGLIDVGDLGLAAAHGRIAALGDASGNQQIDLFVVSQDQRSVTLWQWDKTSYVYRASSEPPISAPPSFLITNVVPGDYNYDGRLDVLLMGQSNPGGWFNSDELNLAAYLGQGQGAFGPAQVLPSSGLAQPIPIDASGNMTVDLLGSIAADASKPQLWSNTRFSGDNSSLFEIKSGPFDQATLDSFDCQFPNPHSNALIDLNGDCLADLFLTCVNPRDATQLSYKIFTNEKEGGFRFAQGGNLPRGTGQIIFADMDRDGTIDMIFPTCTSSGDNCYINIAYNKQVPLCQPRQPSMNSDGSLQCRSSGALCVADPGFSFDLTPLETNDAFTRIPLKALIPDAPYLMLFDESIAGTVPLALQPGDYNKDGYPDLLLISSSSRLPRSGTPSLIESRACDKSSCTSAEIAQSRRVFLRVVAGAHALNSINDARSASFLDVDEEGSLDMMIQRTGAKAFTFIKNKYYADAFFLKALVVNGACERYCFPATGDKYHPYGVSYSGASFKFTVLDPSGTRRATSVGQLPQTSYMNLATPYSYFGLGRTNNYVENLFIGSTRHQPLHYINVEGLIPNSQVVIVPWQPRNVQEPYTWMKELYLRPGDWIPWVGVVLIVATSILGIVVLVLHLNERREDERERQKKLHYFNFQAL
ncbi:uncharacterized protein L969DRAFT_93210 [Mixia osmundae IAM 14324]|uniref:T-cell immunomodulatory protein TIP C2 domain-containing protein n=1 Tax=Mixia osmundae (strain CBS 9802 / IAM 14324 / JCM 22182 / KY 12970) TaxID=764103 RepID=G7E5S2_MIXOS|nr:uncharacterized protein L969DRAFT_93210 [Mixia osmundae IAM 14324]KEI40668.1 hypothetical protein L969DRAFT_93210 [Mixia osmundae IAM 14324]GAA98182.1 hypothetical protein E5Q_04865 [Mixia osmundae IAM 14324]